MFDGPIENALDSRGNAAGSATFLSVRTFRAALWNALGLGAGRGSMIEMTQRIGSKAVADCDPARAEAANSSISFHGVPFCSMAEEHLKCRKAQLALALSRSVSAGKRARSNEVTKTTGYPWARDPAVRKVGIPIVAG